MSNTVYETKESSIADPGPLGLACFALTTFCLSMINAGLVDKAASIVVIALALVYGGATQILAGMWEYKKNNVFGATAFASYGAFWISLGVFDLLGALHLVAVILLTIGAAGNETAHTLGGYAGILTAFAAWYTSAAGIFNTVFGRVILPVGPFKK